MSKWAMLAIGGVVGTFARYLLGAWVPAIAGTGFPYGTFLINLSACFIIGMFNSMAQVRGILGPEARILLMTGFCGAYSTFSTWMLESSNLFADGEPTRAFANLFGSAIIGFLLLRLGAMLGAII
jgi:CrcB protein